MNWLKAAQNSVEKGKAMPEFNAEDKARAGQRVAINALSNGFHIVPVEQWGRPALSFRGTDSIERSSMTFNSVEVRDAVCEFAQKEIDRGSHWIEITHLLTEEKTDGA
jgi:hypothetical protein